MMEAPPPAGFFGTASVEEVEDYLGYQYALEDLRTRSAPRKERQKMSPAQQIADVAARMARRQHG